MVIAEMMKESGTHESWKSRNSTINWQRDLDKLQTI